MYKTNYGITTYEASDKKWIFSVIQRKKKTNMAKKLLIKFRF